MDRCLWCVVRSVGSVLDAQETRDGSLRWTTTENLEVSTDYGDYVGVFDGLIEIGSVVLGLSTEIKRIRCTRPVVI